jgi:uncharacterized protein (TIGR00255 family)
MPVYSMTGYANARAEGGVAGGNDTDHAGGAFERDSGGKDGTGPTPTVELRSVNGRFLDLSLRLPDEVRGLEPALRELVASRLKRGKVELRVALGGEAATGWPAPRPAQLSRLVQLQDAVRTWLPQAAPLTVHEALGWCRGTTPAVRDDEAVLAAARRALDQLQAARAAEGERLAAALRERTAALRALADRAEPLVPELVRRQQQRFLERFAEALAAADSGQAVSAQTAQERALGEAAAFAIRIDVAEEITRLRAHLDAIDQLLTRGGELGKRLEFLIQELLREAHTLGSKSSSLELTNLSVEMKVLVEQLREQVQNIE